MGIRTLDILGAIILLATRFLKIDLLFPPNYSSWGIWRAFKNCCWVEPIFTEWQGGRLRVFKSLLFSRKYFHNIICADYWNDLLCVNISVRKIFLSPGCNYVKYLTKTKFVYWQEYQGPECFVAILHRPWGMLWWNGLTVRTSQGQELMHRDLSHLPKVTV